MSWLKSYVRSTVGAKQVMAISGAALIGFAIAHMAGHFIAFKGQKAYNDYAEGLQNLGGILWILRGGLLFMAIVHVGSSLYLRKKIAAARPVKYQVVKPVRSTWYGRAMFVSGLLLLAFIIFHLAHFTLGLIDRQGYAMVDAEYRHDVYGMLVAGFQRVPYAVGYIFAMALLCMHLAHGASSLFQTLGINHPKYNGLIAKIGPTLGTLLFLGYSLIPVAVLAGWIR